MLNLNVLCSVSAKAAVVSADAGNGGDSATDEGDKEDEETEEEKWPEEIEEGD
jgi:ribosomal protein L12E/L44/L45/RPP1/RPP2